MLVLSRKAEQEVIIGGSVVLKVLSVRGDTVKLGVVAPQDTTIHRREVFERIQSEQSSGE